MSDTSVSHSEHSCQAGADTFPSGGITTRARIDHIEHVERRGSLRKLSATSDQEKACLSDDWRLPGHWRQWTENNFHATEADIQKSAAVFHDRYHADALTSEQWIAKWRKWCKRENLFAARCVKVTTDGSFTHIKTEIQLTALLQWCKGIGCWDDKIGPEPKSQADALARIASLEAQTSHFPVSSSLRARCAA
jgi:hypothetical protein